MTPPIEQQYQKLTDVEHVLLRPGRYLGSTSNHTERMWVVQDGKMIKREVTYNPALLKMFDEIYTNSIDASKKNSKLNKITIDVGAGGSITVWDNGGIPVVIHKEHNQYVPEMIFSELRAGSNFDDEQDNDGAGQNGEGASLTNIFSKFFRVETCDGSKQFYQEWQNNMSKTFYKKPKITVKKSGHTMINWLPDYERLGCTMDDDNFAMLEARVYAGAACNPKLKIILNGVEIKFKSFKDYVAMFTEDFVFDFNDDWKIGVARSEDGFEHMSFVNSTRTATGGNHVGYIADQITDAIREAINKKHKVDVKPASIKQHMMLFIDARINKPRYTSQTKDDLSTEVRNFGTSIEISQKAIRDILKSDIIKSVLDWIAAKQKQEELAALRKAQREIKKKKIADHVNANSTVRSRCIFHIMEGESAMSNFINVRDARFHGAYALTGKPPNWRKKDELSGFAKHKAISSIMNILGLEFDKPAVCLNYGKIRICTDADLDGAGSIVGLLLNFFSMWPELFENNMIEVLRSPIVIATKGKDIQRFYTMDEYLANHKKLSGYAIKYNKGLGSLSVDEYDIMINQPVVDVITLDDEALENLEMVFGDDVEPRKVWLSE